MSGIGNINRKLISRLLQIEKLTSGLIKIMLFENDETYTKSDGNTEQVEKRL